MAGCPDLSSLDPELLADLTADTGSPDIGSDSVADAGDEPDTDDGGDGGADTDDIGDPDAFEPPDIEEPAPTLDEISTQVFLTSCAPHHIDRPSGGLSLAPGERLHDDLLSASVQNPAMARVAPGELDASYLWHKLNGTHEQVGGSGNQMPLGNPLDSERLDLVRRWIEGGALE